MLLHNSLVYEEAKKFSVSEDQKVSSVDLTGNPLTQFKSVTFVKKFSLCKF